jgi:hypothetical protein
MSVYVGRVGAIGLALVALFLSPRIGRAQEATQAADAPPAISVQTRGPIHEAYAQPVDQTPKPGPVVPKKPPAPVPELPPDQKPEGNNVRWIPGYWAWDLDRSDYLWVSGFWRNAPPGRKWVPGHWAQAEGGWQWVAGLWAASNLETLPYQQAPPDSLDYGPATPAPNDDSLYVPGCWILRDGRYVWRPGYWMDGHTDWVWVPGHYVWTPAGDIFVDGYWDYVPEDRGLLFAPVVFNEPLWETPGWSFTPSYSWYPCDFLSSLFVCPRWCHYYCGDYFGAPFARLGFFPWCSFGPRFNDPLFAWFGWRHRGDRNWFRGLRDDFLAREHGDLPRLPHTLAEQNRLLRDHNGAADGLRVVQPLDRLDPSRTHLTRLTEAQVAEHRHVEARVRDVSRQRQEVEQPGHSGPGKADFSLKGLPEGPPHLSATERYHTLGSHELGMGQAPGGEIRHEARHQGSEQTAEHPIERDARVESAPRHDAPAVVPEVRAAAVAPPAMRVAPSYSPPAYHPAPAYHAMPAPAFHAAPAFHGGGGGHMGGGGGHGGGGHGHR